MLLGDSKDHLALIESLIIGADLDIVLDSTNLANAADEVSEYNPNLVILFNNNSPWVFRACQQIYQLHPEVVVVIVGEGEDFNAAKNAINAGSSAFIAPLPEPEQFSKQLRQIYYNEQDRKKMLLESFDTNRKSEVLVIYAPKGGMGKTMIGTNLAVELSRRGAKVCYVDFDLLFGDANIYLGADYKYTLVDLLQDQKVINIDSIRDYLTLTVSGVTLLGAPSSPEYVGNVSSALVEPLINVLRKSYDYVICDTTCSFSDLNLYLMEASSKILFLANLDICSLSASKKSLMLLDSLNFRNKVSLVVNKQFSGDIRKDDVERIMDQEVEASVPYAYELSIKSLNQGVPIVLDAKTPISKGIYNLADLFIPVQRNSKDSKFRIFKSFRSSTNNHDQRHMASDKESSNKKSDKKEKSKGVKSFLQRRKK